MIKKSTNYKCNPPKSTRSRKTIIHMY